MQSGFSLKRLCVCVVNIMFRSVVDAFHHNVMHTNLRTSAEHCFALLQILSSTIIMQRTHELSAIASGGLDNFGSGVGCCDDALLCVREEQAQSGRCPAPSRMTNKNTARTKRQPAAFLTAATRAERKTRRAALRPLRQSAGEQGSLPMPDSLPSHAKCYASQSSTFSLSINTWPGTWPLFGKRASRGLGQTMCAPASTTSCQVPRATCGSAGGWCMRGEDGSSHAER